MYIYVLAYVGTMLVSFLYSRITLGIIKSDSMNNSQYAKRRRGQTFWDWFFYRRFKDVIPLPLWILYITNFILCIILVTLVILSGVLNIPTAFFQSAAGGYGCLYIAGPLFIGERYVHTKK